ncbi:hypothetical protein [Dyella lutea]|uniref:Nitrogen fixation protein FixH n=1 Tax=Dyella lutea TaxID=2950441 RepID=A0ABT1F933_9GAMM|nr:hypothetical protein [Dyella lutea]MCP1373867.1 hypothetical protein [Dyella lutea]
MNKPRNAWREPMVWMLIGLPLAMVAIGFALLFAAVDHAGPTADTPDRVTRLGHLQLTAEEAPQTRGSKPVTELILRHNGGMIEAVPTDARIARGGDLTVVLTAQDASAEVLTLHLKPSELGWRGAGVISDARNWRIEATSDRAPWRLQGQWPAEARFARLAP